MYSQLSMEGELATNDYKTLSTHKTLGLISRIYGLNLIEGDPLKGEN
jgi:hypothetical protein